MTLFTSLREFCIIGTVYETNNDIQKRRKSFSLSIFVRNIYYFLTYLQQEFLCREMIWTKVLIKSKKNNEPS